MELYLLFKVCREYQRGSCSREECRYAHPPPHASIDSTDGMITVCMDFMKGRCQREMCRYFHPPAHLQGRVRAAQQQSIPVSSVFFIFNKEMSVRLEGKNLAPGDWFQVLVFDLIDT